MRGSLKRPLAPKEQTGAAPQLIPGGSNPIHAIEQFCRARSRRRACAETTLATRFENWIRDLKSRGFPQSSIPAIRNSGNIDSSISVLLLGAAWLPE